MQRSVVLSHILHFTTPRTGVCQAPLSGNFPDKDTGVGCHFVLQECNNEGLIPPENLNQ